MSDAADWAGIEVTFLGTGTSAGVPMIGCDCEVCTSADPRDQRTRCSVVVRGGGVSVLVDTTPELRLQAVANGIKRIDAVVFTHGHADHVCGLDDLRRFNSIKAGPLDVFADAATHETLSTMFAYAWREPDPVSKLFRPHLARRVVAGPFEGRRDDVDAAELPARPGDGDGLPHRPRRRAGRGVLHGLLRASGRRAGNAARFGSARYRRTPADQAPDASNNRRSPRSRRRP